jgi:diguanylate cyclase (GGDEF)-like protein
VTHTRTTQAPVTGPDMSRSRPLRAVIAIATKRPAVPVSAAARRSDLATRLKGRLRSLRSRVGRLEAILEAVREGNATLDPERVAEWLVQQAEAWVPAPCWAVVIRDARGLPSVLANRGLTEALEPSLFHAASWVLSHHAEFFAADLSRDKRAGKGAGGSAIGFPLHSRGRTVGVLLAIDSEASHTVPALGPALLAALRDYLEPAALALDNALTFKRVEALTVIDDLTRLYNSRFLHQVLHREIKRSSRHSRPISLLFIDLDEFKAVNDTYGHLAGSKALVEVGAVLRRCARESDVVARFGGDEFVVVLPETPLEGARALAVRLRHAIVNSQFLLSDGASVRLTASIGVATLPDMAGTAEELLRAADAAMYRVKASGKDGIQVALESPPHGPTPGSSD